jgi:hypothetical protein
MITRNDSAHNLLIPFVKETESLLLEALRSFDKNSKCRISVAPDLGFPHDVVRIAGGFPTGTLVEWDCNEPFIPVDTTVNIDTSTIFYLDQDVSDKFTEKDFTKLRENIEKSSYLFNFHKGNHFISFGRIKGSGHPVLVLHSNEKEFKYQYNGLMPAENNWFMDDVKYITRGNRYLRYIHGDKAVLFSRMAKSLEDFNIVRHHFIAQLLLNGKASIIEQFDYHHYFMPSNQSVAIGCFLVEEGSSVPIFSKPGRDINIFKAKAGGKNRIKEMSSGDDKLLVPHGWGKTCQHDIEFNIDLKNKEFSLSGKKYDIKTEISLGKDERLYLRDYDSAPTSDNSLYSLMEHHCPGEVIETIEQISSYTKHGFLRHIPK